MRLLRDGWLILRGPRGVEAVDTFERRVVHIEAAEGADLDALINGAQRNPHLVALARFEPAARSLIEACAKGPSRPLDRASLLRGDGYTIVFVELTGRCNERCVHCYAGARPENDTQLSLEQVLGVVEDVARLGSTRIQFTGGEPLISPHLFKAVAKAHAEGIPQIEVYTNGIALTERVLERLSPFDVRFALSFYSADASTHDAVTQTPGSQARTVAAIRRLVRDKTPFRVSIIGTATNREDVDRTYHFLQDLGAPRDAVSVAFSKEVGRGREESEPSLDAWPEAWRDAQSNAGPSVRSLSGKAAVSYDGTVFPCIFARRFPLGNIRDRRLIDILNDPQPLAGGADELLATIDSERSRLGCLDCRVRAALLGGPSQGGQDL